MAYGTIKVDTVTFTSEGIDTSVSISGLVRNPTFSGNITSTSTISGVTIQGGTLVSGATVTGSAGQFSTITGGVVNFTTITGVTANIASGVFASGTAANPSISINGDSDTGIYSPGANQLAITANGVDKLLVNSSGNVVLSGTLASRVTSSATSGTIAPDSNSTDLYLALGLTDAVTFAVPSGAPVNGQKLLIRIKDNGTARAITWTTSAGGYRAIGVTLPTTTVAGKVTYAGLIYNSNDSYWDIIATVTEA